jgi:ParB family chromosome partitioning protein
MIERKLGRGLDYLIGDGVDASEDEIRHVETAAIRPNPYQPRKHFDAAALRELEDSIRRHGVLQPLLLRQVDDAFEIVAGERRWRAARAAGLPTVPAVVRGVPDEGMLELALVENLQREDLNPIERAEAYRSYLEAFRLTQDEAAVRLGKDRSTIANAIRLLDLPEEIRLFVSRGTVSAGHARAILGLDGDEARTLLARRVVEEGLSVRVVERLVRDAGTPGRSRGARAPGTRPPYLADLEGRLRERLGTRVTVQDRGGRGKLVIEYFSREELDRVLEVIGA